MNGRACLSALAVLGLSAANSRAASPALKARVECQRAAAPGRILCELTTTARSGKLVWSDALVVRAPGFARPLRSRIAMQIGAAAGSGVATAKLALVASQPGRGTLEILARAVVCRAEVAGELCTAELLPLTATVEVVQANAFAPAP